MSRFRARFSYCTVLLTLVTIVASPATFADDLKTDTSLGWVPADTAFYSSMPRGEEQWNRIANSRAFKRTKQLFVVQAGMAMLKGAIDSNDDMAEGIEQASDFWEQMKETGVADLLNDGWRNEVYVLGNQDWGTWLRLVTDMSNEIQQVQLQAIGGDSEDMETGVERVIKQTAIDAAGLDLPRLLIGMRLTDKAPADKIIARLEEFLKEAIDQPGISIQRTEGEQNSFVELVVKSNDLPWKEWARDAESDDQKDAIQTARRTTADKEVHVALGVHGDDFLISIGPDLKTPKDLKNGKLLLDIDEMKRVRSVADKRVSGISYVSREFIQSVSRPAAAVDNFSQMIRALISNSDWAESDPDLAQDVTNDIDDFANDMKRWIPKPSTVVAVDWMIENGYESYIQNWGENLYLDGSKKLDILEQAGESPIMLAASRTKEAGPGYALMSKWTRRGRYWFDRMIAEQDVPDEAAEAMDVVMPLVTKFGNRFDSITTDVLIPSMDGQSAVIMDDKLTSDQWIPLLPESKNPLKLPEFGIVYRLSDGKQFQKAMDDYSAWGQDILQEVRNVVEEQLAKSEKKLKDAEDEDDKDDAEDEIDELQKFQDQLDTLPLPDVEEREIANGELHLIPISEIWVDDQIAPSLAVTDRTAVFSLSPKTAERLTANKSAPTTGLVAENADRPLAAAAVFHPHRITEMLREWSEYGFKVASESSDNNQLQMFSGQVDSILEIIGCYKKVESITFEDGDSLVTHSRSLYEDL